MNLLFIEIYILIIEIIFGVYIYRENDVVQFFKDEDWRFVVIIWVFVDGLDIYLYEFFSF